MRSASAASCTADVVPGHDGDAGADGELTGGGLAAHRRNRFRRRPDEHQALVPNESREPLALRQKPIAGVDRLGADSLGGFDDAVAAQVALGGRRRPHVHRLVCLAHMRRGRVGVAVDRDRPDPELTTRADDAESDFAPVGYQNFREHRYRQSGTGNREPGSVSPRSHLFPVPSSRFPVPYSGMFPCFFGGFRSRFRSQRRKRVDESRPCVARIDDVIDVAATRRNVRVRELVRVLADLPIRRGSRVVALRRSRDERESRRRPSAP